MTTNRISLLSLLIIVLSCFTFSRVNAQWEMRYPDVQTNCITDMVFINSTTGFFINSAGSIMMTTDMGSTWKRKCSITGQNLSKIRFLDEKNGSILSSVSQNGSILSSVSQYYQPSFLYCTTDGGNSWLSPGLIMDNVIDFLPMSPTVNIQSTKTGEIQLGDGFRGELTTVYKLPMINPSGIYSTYGTIVGFQKLSNRILALGNSSNAKACNIISDSVSFFLQSKDQALSWDTLWCDLPYSMYAFNFANDKIGWMGGEHQQIYKTTDGGESWSLQFSDSEVCTSIIDIFPLDSLNIYASDNYGHTIYSNDGGINWTVQKIFSSLNYANNYRVRFLNHQKGFVIGSDLMVTENAGQSWNRLSKSIKDDILKIDFVNDSLGWGISNRSIYFTSDGGYNWAEQYKQTSGDCLYSLDMIDSENGWALSNRSLYHTIDGKTWQQIVIDFNCGSNSKIKFWDINNGIIFHDQGQYSGQGHYVNYITTDGGRSWHGFLCSEASNFNYFNNVDFSDKDHLWHCGNKGLLLSTDLGKTWTSKNPGVPLSPFSTNNVDFLDSLNGWMGINDDSIAVTSDGGNTWQRIKKPLNLMSTDLLTVGKNKNDMTFALEAGENGILVRYLPNYYGGYYEGIIQDTYTKSRLRSIAQYNSRNHANLWVAGDGFTVLYYKDNISDVEKEGHKELQYSLSQNYPNPFNPATTISYSLAKQSQVEIKVFDLLGREITTLVNKEQNSGEYKVRFDGSSLPSGIYIYTIHAGEYRASRKIMLLK